MTARLCSGCDAPLYQGFCPSCDDVMPSYDYAPDFGDEVLSVNGSGSYLGVVRSPVMMGGFEREAHTGLIHQGEDRRAA